MKKSLLALVLIGAVGAVCWWQRTPLLAWYYVHRLIEADEASRDDWARRVAGLDVAVLPRLMDGLEDRDSARCTNITAGLLELGKRWEVEDGRTLDLAEELQQRFDRFSSGGQVGVLSVLAQALRRSPSAAAPARMAQAAGELLTATAAMPALRQHVLDLAGALVEHVQPGQWRDVCQDLAKQSFKDAQPEMRVQGISLFVRLARGADPSFLARLAPLLHDPATSVRRATILAVGPYRDAVADDDLLPLLHDPDDEVGRLVELALRSRGLEENHILLARLISDERPGQRLQVLDHLRAAGDLEPGAWLLRLSADPVPAVRAAAIRAAHFQPHVNLAERLRQMARQDPSPTVRQVAEYYLSP